MRCLFESREQTNMSASMLSCVGDGGMDSVVLVGCVVRR